MSVIKVSNNREDECVVTGVGALTEGAPLSELHNQTQPRLRGGFCGERSQCTQGGEREGGRAGRWGWGSGQDEEIQDHETILKLVSLS